MIKTIKHVNNLPYFGDEDLLGIAQTNSFASMVFEMLSGKKPSTSQIKLFELILNISIDHGPDTPSAIETIKAGQNGKNISDSVAAGIIQINDTHGGAIEPAMELFYKIESDKLDIHDLVKEYLDQDKKMPGFGHRIYETDPRAQLIFKIAEEEKIEDKYINIAKSISTELNKIKGRTIPTNIDGAIAAILCTFGWESKLAKAVFIIARTPGLCGQYLNIISPK